MPTIQDRVMDLVADQLDRPRREITPESRFIEDFATDSLDLLELTMELEAEFGLGINDEEGANMKTVGDVIAYIEKRQEK